MYNVTNPFDWMELISLQGKASESAEEPLVRNTSSSSQIFSSPAYRPIKRPMSLDQLHPARIGRTRLAEDISGRMPIFREVRHSEKLYR